MCFCCTVCAYVCVFFLPNQACWSPCTSIARPKSASLTAAPFILLASNRFSGCGSGTRRQRDTKRETLTGSTPSSPNKSPCVMQAAAAGAGFRWAGEQQRDRGCRKGERERGSEWETEREGERDDGCKEAARHLIWTWVGCHGNQSGVI